MKTVIIILIVIIIAAGVYFFFIKSEEIEPQSALTQTSMNISSSAFEHNSSMPTKYTCDGDDINPDLIFSDIPEEAKSLALIMDDPDAPMGTWVHWTVWNISAQTTEIAQNSIPDDVVEGKQSWGKSGYGGPCPPSGTHRYFFKLYALDTTLDLSSEADKAELVNAMKDHIIAQAELIGLYQRQ
ncbi:YbhB/YbcL family Raf kinase inhibitor-like protein [Patescibacteria group bacterium AH-259-L05]|nr:YbhB/YbcL family Raf kinase inhibitor-like protein [Patescibacteria group bacterium AH-259-L05]